MASCVRSGPTSNAADPTISSSCPPLPPVDTAAAAAHSTVAAALQSHRAAAPRRPKQPPHSLAAGRLPRSTAGRRPRVRCWCSVADQQPPPLTAPSPLLSKATAPLPLAAQSNRRTPSPPVASPAPPPVAVPAFVAGAPSPIRKPLFSGCSKFTKLSSMLKLYNLKAKNRWSDKSFTELLKLLKDMLPDDNELPCSTYEAKKMLCPLSMDIERIHACPNDCILYWKQYKDLHVCPECGASRYKRKGYDDACEKKKGVPVKVLWYLPVIPRFKHLFANANDANNLQWHAIGRKEDGKLRHPADSPQWKNINMKFPEFGSENENLRLGLCTDRMNPHGNMSSRHSTWPVLLTVYNLPRWLCMKRKYIMLSLLISGPKQPGNDIDVYLTPLIEDLKILWNEGVAVFDAHSQTNFTLRAMLFCTINDFPAYGNLSGYTTKGAKACPIYEDETDDLWLNNSKKNVFMSHRTFLPIDHPYRKKKKVFNGKSEARVARSPLSGDVVYERVKNIDNVLGKTSKTSQKGKTKDGIKARKDMVEMGIRDQLAPQESGKRAYLPPACYTSSKKEKTSFCSFLNGIKVPSGYSSNIKKLVSMKDFKLVGMKSHGCHVLMQHMLPVAIRGILPNHVRQIITKLCYFFNAISSKHYYTNGF
ncbi:uncharacterized protein LOC116029760 [Ipomoea triloba]|uniref:uncharacterized protein LOC116029760 n=1 Tax=Ipomoea triloba TaxID=35885 RepID=UPI00125E59C0|nr:uncharacterized protein LOC116029760 [Ipomoea triloba]